MKKQWTGYILWLILVAGLYFFENHTGTRTVLIASVLPVCLLPVRSVFLKSSEKDRNQTPAVRETRIDEPGEQEEPGEIRQYRPGDPIRSIHWKLSAKKDDLLIVESVREPSPQKNCEWGSEEHPAVRRTHYAVICLALLFVADLLLLFLIPEAFAGLQALCNRLFLASQAANAYVYELFQVPETQSVTLASVFLGLAAGCVIAVCCVSSSRVPMLALMAAWTLAQIYFGLTPPGQTVTVIYGLIAISLMRRPYNMKSLLLFIACLTGIAVAVSALIPGVDASTESASETVRDHLSRITESFTGASSEDASEELPARHVFTQSLVTGGGEAQIVQSFRLETVEEEQISLPHWVNYARMILLLLLTALLLVLPFLPFALLNQRRKKALQAREVFHSQDVNEAVTAIFRCVIRWLELCGHGHEDLLYRDWPEHLPTGMPDGYAKRFAECAEDFEKAVYSEQDLSEERRDHAIALLRETERALYPSANRKKRLYLKYWMCMCE